ncbi:cupin domain-containing protein [Microvirga antarctica]|uniref:cupin domain-containing protein n=1 Tax=Microvirga antarctica TaxID=2819233 RepID=UPI001B317977|nr:cupin domain-containing protein [Microvirga antarctica]
MSIAEPRILSPMKEMFRRDEDIESFPLTNVEGTNFTTPSRIKILMVTEDMHCIKVFRVGGTVDPVHQHDDHSTIMCLLSGKLILHIGDETFTAEPGDVWYHPQGVPHYTETLVDSVQIEVKAPACKTW